MKDVNISLLWQLQKLEEEINEINKEIKLKEIMQKLKGLKCEYENIKVEIQGKVVQYKEWEHKLTRINLKNKNYNYEIKELQDKIYGGKITNVTALSKLKSELDEFKKEIDRSEEEILDIMEKMELIQKDIKIMKKSMLKIQVKYKIEKDNYNIENDIIQNKQKTLSKRLSDLQGKIEKNTFWTIEIYKKT
jgi:predicted  nucleic acid-binding Zn-ribbon protein